MMILLANFYNQLKKYNNELDLYYNWWSVKSILSITAYLFLHFFLNNKKVKYWQSDYRDIEL